MKLKSYNGFQFFIYKDKPCKSFIIKALTGFCFYLGNHMNLSLTDRYNLNEEVNNLEIDNIFDQ